jgi:carotenoid cleavage dioxygenase
MTPTRRSFLAGSAAAALGLLMPVPLIAADAPAGSIPAEEWRSIWTAPADELDLDGLAVHGRWPADLALTLYRNGPALHTMGGYRYRHWFDGDGMIRAWTVGPQGARVRTWLIRTAKLAAEQAAGRRLLPAFGSLPPGARADAMADAMNPANINALPFAGSLLALWEAGSAYRLDQDTLKTVGQVVWGKWCGARTWRACRFPPIHTSTAPIRSGTSAWITPADWWSGRSGPMALCGDARFWILAMPG